MLAQHDGKPYGLVMAPPNSLSMNLICFYCKQKQLKFTLRLLGRLSKIVNYVQWLSLVSHYMSRLLSFLALAPLCHYCYVHRSRIFPVYFSYLFTSSSFTRRSFRRVDIDGEMEMERELLAS